MRLVRELLEDDSACQRRVLFVDTFHLTGDAPQCTKQGDGRHYPALMPAVWQLLLNAYTGWTASERLWMPVRRSANRSALAGKSLIMADAE